jgi:hypothetical protein
MNLDAGREYKQFELPDNLFNVGNGSTVNSGGKNYTANVNSNGTRSFALGANGGSTVDLNAPTAQAQQNKTDLQNLFTNQAGQQSDFLNRYTSAIKGQEGSSAMATRIGNELGVPQLQANAQSLNQTLFNLPSTYSAATTGRDVNANQLSRIVGTKQVELSPAAALATQNAQQAQSNLNTRMGYEQADQSKALLPYQTEQQLLTDRLTRESTGYSAANQSILDSIIAKMNAGVTLSEGEKTRAQQLAVQEMQYKQAMDVANVNQTASDPYKSLSEGQTLYNTATGQPVYTAAKTYKPTSGGTSGTSTLTAPSSGWSVVG